MKTDEIWQKQKKIEENVSSESNKRNVTENSHIIHGISKIFQLWKKPNCYILCKEELALI